MNATNVLSRREFLARLGAPDDGVRVAVRPYPGEKTPVSLLGLGGIHLPVSHRDKNNVDVARVCDLVDYALAHGVNYFDTGYVYHNGNGEKAFGAALSRHPRDSYFLGDKMPTWRARDLAGAKRIFEEQLARCRTDYFDFYMLHSLGSEDGYRKVYEEQGVLAYLDEEKRRGRIRHLGFSFHGGVPFLEKLLAKRHWDMCLIQLNPIVYSDRNNARRQYELLTAAKTPVWVMEPLAGGRCAVLNEAARKMLKAARPEASVASWGLRFAAGHPNVTCVVSGMGRAEHLIENVHTLSRDHKPLTAHESELYLKAVNEFLKHKTVNCTGCAYCMPCPYGVDIPEVFAWWNSYAAEGALPETDPAKADPAARRAFLRSYARAIPRLQGAERCIGCRECLKACPQWTFRIPTEMENIDAFIENQRRMG